MEAQCVGYSRTFPRMTAEAQKKAEAFKEEIKEDIDRLEFVGYKEKMKDGI